MATNRIISVQDLKVEGQVADWFRGEGLSVEGLVPLHP